MFGGSSHKQELGTDFFAIGLALFCWFKCCIRKIKSFRLIPRIILPSKKNDKTFQFIIHISTETSVTVQSVYKFKFHHFVLA